MTVQASFVGPGQKPKLFFFFSSSVIFFELVNNFRLPFRMLVRKYECDLAFTPMIIANSFVRSQKARDSEFTTCKGKFILYTL